MAVSYFNSNTFTHVMHFAVKNGKVRKHYGMSSFSYSNYNLVAICKQIYLWRI
jgi:hypothetical protein